MKAGQKVLVDGCCEGTIIAMIGNTECLVQFKNGFVGTFCCDRVQIKNKEPENRKVINEWELARLMLSEDENIKQLCDSLQMQPINIIQAYPPEEIVAKLDEIANQIKVDDVVIYTNINEKERVGVVTKISPSHCHATVLTLHGNSATMPLSKLRKTGSNIPIMEFLNEKMKNIVKND